MFWLRILMNFKTILSLIRSIDDLIGRLTGAKDADESSTVAEIKQKSSAIKFTVGRKGRKRFFRRNR